MEINGYTLVNPDKVERAINGSVTSKGMMLGGVGEEATDEAKLAEYDRLGGLVTRGTDKVKMGSFYDFKLKKPRETPEIVFVYRVNGQLVEVPDGEVLPGEVRAAKILEEANEASFDEDADVGEEKPKKASKKEAA